MTVSKKQQFNVKIAASEQILAYKHVFFRLDW